MLRLHGHPSWPRSCTTLSCCVLAITPIRGCGEGAVAKTDAVKTEVSKRGIDFLALVKKIRKSKSRSRDLAVLRRELARDPDLWRCYGDLSTAAVGLIINDAVSALAPGDQAIFRESMKAGQQQMRAALGYESSPPLERLLVDQVCLCWLRLSCVELYYTEALRNNKPIYQCEFWERRLSATQQRFLRASAALARIRRLRLPAMQINIGNEQVNVVSE